MAAVCERKAIDLLPVNHGQFFLFLLDLLLLLLFSICLFLLFFFFFSVFFSFIGGVALDCTAMTSVDLNKKKKKNRKVLHGVESHF